jgi:hypothetical protein
MAPVEETKAWVPTGVAAIGVVSIMAPAVGAVSIIPVVGDGPIVAEEVGEASDIAEEVAAGPHAAKIRTTEINARLKYLGNMKSPFVYFS